MQKTSVILTCALFFGALGTSEAHPLDSSDIVCIDGQPCNSACQSYMAWSRQIMPMPNRPALVPPRAAACQKAPRAVTRRAIGIGEAGSKPAAHGRIANEVAPKSTEAPQAKITDLQPGGKAAAASDAAGAKIADLRPTGAVTTDSHARTTQELVTAATALADRITVATANSQGTAPTPSNDTDPRIAILVARPEIKSLSDLAGKEIAIDDKRSASSGNVRTAIAAAGAPEVQVTEGQRKAIDRVIGGEVLGAVLTLASREAAEAFPEIAGFKILRIPLALEIPRAKIADSLPPVGVATDSRIRTTQQQVTAATAVAERVTAATAVAILMARPEIKSVSDLAGKSIAIDSGQSASSGSVRSAIVMAGAAEVQLAENQTKALDRLIGGKVSAAVLTLASPEAAEGFPEIAGFNIFRIPLTPEMPRTKIADLQAGANVAAAPDTPGAKIADLRRSGTVTTDSHTKTMQELVTAATVLAERMTVAMADHQRTASMPSNDADPRTAIIMARPEIKSMSDLAGKEIAIDDKQSSSSSNVLTAIAAAGAAQIQVSEGQTKAIDRVIVGEVPAAVLTLVSREAAQAFPEIAGFKIFRIPLTPEMPPAKIVNPQPAGKGASAFDTVGAKIAALRSVAPVAADSHPETIQEQVAAATELAERMTAATAGPQDSEQIASSTGRSDRLETAPSDNSDPRVAILMARPEIKVVSDLSGKEIAIDGKQSASSGNIRAAIVAAGAAEVQVSEDQTQVINRLILAQVPAAVLTLVSPEAAEAFPEITGFRIFRVPLSPRSILVIRAPVTNGSSSASVSPPIKTSSQPIDPGPSDDLDRVIADLDRTSQRTPEDAQAYRDRGNAWGSKGDTDRALADYQQAIRINPNSASVSPPTSSQPIDPGPSDDLDRVIADLDRAIQRSPEDAQAYRDRGNAWGRKGDTDRALADYQQAIRINPNDPAIFHDSGRMWQRKGEFDKAIVDFDRAVRMSFSDPEIYSDRGAAWFEKGSYDRALADFNQALKINPALATAYVRRAGVFERKGDQERARANREQATRLGGPSLTQPDGRSGEVRDH
jgi:Flp pilus assembly protein TadD/TRAP-type uncharacterized transport system substrate-binding protein